MTNIFISDNSSSVTHIRNYNFDFARAIATMLVLVYHCWVLCGSAPIKFPFLDLIIPMGGEIGVTLFFMLSGYGIYCSLSNSDKNNTLSFKSFITKRVKRIIPEYYINLFIVLLFTDSAVYLSIKHIPNILAHLFFVHNIIRPYSGAINGVLWTMGTIFQFYLVAIILYKLINKFKGFFIVFSIVITIVLKYVFFFFLNNSIPSENFSMYAFWLGRQLPTALDNFVLGMGIAWLTQNTKIILSKLSKLLLIILSVSGIIYLCQYGFSSGIYFNNTIGRIWHSCLAVLLAVFLFALYYVKISTKNIVSKALLWLSKYEYGIYLWHLVMIRNLLNKSELIQNLLNQNYFIVVYFILITLSIILGYLFTLLVRNGLLNFKNEKIN